MAAIEKLSPEQWARIRRVWEQDQRKGFSWVLERIPVPVTRAAIRNRAIREGWSKRLEGFPAKECQGLSAGKRSGKTSEHFRRRSPVGASTAMEPTDEGFPERQKPTAKTYEILSIENHTQGSSRLCEAAVAVLVRVGTSSPESMAIVLKELAATCVSLEDDEAAQLTERFSDVLLTAIRAKDEGMAVLAELLEAKG